MNRKLYAQYGLKYNPFCNDIPASALVPTPAIDEFCWRVQHQISEGGFSLIWGEQPGIGKSSVLRILSERLQDVPDVCCRVLTRPQAHLADFYRELGHLFGVALSPHNRWAGASVLRTKWLVHTESSLTRPILLVDEAQEMTPAVLSELRLLASAELDARSILSIVIAGDSRLRDKLSTPELLPIASRVRIRLHIEAASNEQLQHCLEELLKAAGNTSLITEQVRLTLCEHASGNYRTLMNLANDLLAAAMHRGADQITEKLYHEVFTCNVAPAAKRRKP